MIEPFATEQYLPCHEPELFGVDNRKSIPTEKVTLKVKGDLSLLPMNKGWMLETGRGLFYIDNIAIALLKEIINTPELASYLSDPSKKQELERLNYYNLLDFDVAHCGNLNFRSVPQEIKGLYADNNFGWFSYYPTKIELDLSNLCNFECIHCSRGASPHISAEKEMEFDDIKRIISEAGNLGVHSLQLMGGEPLVYKNFFEICEHAKNVGIKRLETSTNGWNITEKTAPMLAQYFKEIQISLHGATEETHDRIVGKKGAWKQVSKATKILLTKGVTVRFSFTVMNENVHEIEMMPQITKEFGATSLRFLALSNEGRGKNLPEWSKDERQSTGSRIKELFTQEMGNDGDLEIECGGFPALTSLNNKAQFYGCPAGRELLYINAKGSVSCCGVVQEYIGNIYEHSIMELWHHPKMVNLRKVHNCACDYKYICAGPCAYDFSRPYDEKVNYL